jgi:predicted O-methyltransferase YrrM
VTRFLFTGQAAAQAENDAAFSLLFNGALLLVAWYCVINLEVRMADQRLVQSSMLKRPVAPKPCQAYSLRYKLAWRWGVICCWARYLLVGARRGVPELVDFILGNYFFKAIQVPSELTTLGEILKDQTPECALEIGTAFGGTLLFLCRLARPSATIVSVDLPGGRFGGGYKPWRRWAYQSFARRGQRLHLLQGDSQSNDMLARVKAAFQNRPLDYIFIDGDHRYEGVKRDFEIYAPMVRKGGLVAFHDIVEGPIEAVGGVPQFWKEIKRQYRHIEIIHDPRQGGCGLGLLYVD